MSGVLSKYNIYKDKQNLPELWQGAKHCRDFSSQKIVTDIKAFEVDATG